MHEGGHGILDGVKKKHHDHKHGHSYGSSLTTRVSAGVITAAIIVAFILWKLFLSPN